MESDSPLAVFSDYCDTMHRVSPPAHALARACRGGGRRAAVRRDGSAEPFPV